MKGLHRLSEAGKNISHRLSQESGLCNQFQELRQGILENMADVRPSTAEGALKELTYFQGQMDLLNRLIPNLDIEEEEDNG